MAKKKKNKKYWMPSWLADEATLALPAGVGPGTVIKEGKDAPTGPCPQGGRWVHAKKPVWLS